MNVHSFSVKERCISNLSMTNGRVRHKLWDTSGNKEKQINDYSIRPNDI